MYKKFTLDEIKSVKNDFMINLSSVIKRERCQSVNDFVKLTFREWNQVCFMNRQNMIFRAVKNEDSFSFFDEKEKIELFLPFEDRPKLQSLFIRFLQKKSGIVWQKTIEQILFDGVKDWEFSNILDKPYLVYDIETTIWDWNNMKSYEFLLAYAMYPDGENKMKYDYIAKDDIKDFVQKLLDFDWYIIWFNSFFFDNPVSVYNAGFGDEELEIINKKSLDIFLFIQNMTKRRLWLNKLSESLIGVTKTLDSWAEGEVLWKQYLETWDESFLEEFKKYCKNDVRMTAFVLFYLLHFKKIYIDWEDYVYDIETFVEQSIPKSMMNTEDWSEDTRQQSIF